MQLKIEPCGQILRGTLSGLSHVERVPTIELDWGAALPIGAPIVYSQLEREVDIGGTALTFLTRIPPQLYDGAFHAIRVSIERDEGQLVEATIGFVGDPALVLTNVRRQQENTLPQTGRAMSLASDVLADGDPEFREAFRSVVDTLSLHSEVLQQLLRAGPALADANVGQHEANHLLDPLLAQALSRSTPGQDIVFFSVIDWNYRIQRPQHLATKLAERGHTVFYLSVTFEESAEPLRFQLLSSPAPNVFELRLRSRYPITNIYSALEADTCEELRDSLLNLYDTLHLRSPIGIIEYPSWIAAATVVPGIVVVHDCLDYIAGFSNTGKEIIEEENRLLEQADAVIAASDRLRELIADRRESVVIRNAADAPFFAAPPEPSRVAKERLAVGYIGAIAEWFEIDWVTSAARALPQFDFILVGRVHGIDVSEAEELPNARFLGERPYSELPTLLHQFDVCTIPFKLTELIRCTNPVKMYEYLAAGKPVVCSPLPEAIAVGNLVEIASSPSDFAQKISTAAHKTSPREAKRRRKWAAQHTWDKRAEQLLKVFETAFPPVSIVVLAFNQSQFTMACLDSVRQYGDYPALEIIVVDNGSTDDTSELVYKISQSDSRVKLVRSETNLGFAGGNNLGMAEAHGDIVILLNNDTYVTPGWVADLIRPLRRHADIGMAGPLTNQIGNEQKIRIEYSDMHEMCRYSRRFVRKHSRQIFSTDNLAFFCVAIKREVIEKVGYLDDEYGLGFFEDDDYCRRVQNAGYRLAVVDDVFVHHHLSASFDQVGDGTRDRLMKRNRELFERKWGPWTPHRYRAQKGFGD